jgi:hypothetical protein
MNIKDIPNFRLASQQIAGTMFTSAKQIVAWMGAMQAQDYAAVKWAVGVRLPKSTEKNIDAAIDSGDILRTHVLRPTWHLVSADDIRWMLELTAPQIQAGMRSRHKELGLTASVLSKSRKILEKALRDGNHSTREELIPLLNKAGIATDENRASHLFAAAELDGLICSGKSKGGKQTFGLLDERVPQTGPIGRDDALASLAKRYFSSHGPATLDDFDWWSGLSMNDVKCALEMAKSDLMSAMVESKTYWFTEANKTKGSAFLLPAFDEFIISYTDRRATISSENRKRAISSNGMFHPTIVVNGETLGIWKRTIKNDKVTVVFEYFAKPTSASQKLIEAASTRYGEFLEKKVDLQ